VGNAHGTTRKTQTQITKMLGFILLQFVHKVNMECKVWKNLTFWKKKGHTKKKVGDPTTNHWSARLERIV
jgi:hypothetical protein